MDRPSVNGRSVNTVRVEFFNDEQVQARAYGFELSYDERFRIAEVLLMAQLPLTDWLADTLAGGEHDGRTVTLMVRDEENQP